MLSNGGSNNYVKSSSSHLPPAPARRIFAVKRKKMKKVKRDAVVI